MIIDSSTLDSTSAYKLLIGSILPRPIGWVSTQSSNGVANLAPISFFTAVGRKPPMVSLSLQPRADGVTLKDTFVNIRNLATLPLAHALHRTAFEFASDVDEFTAVGVEKEASAAVRPPRIKGVPISLECKLDRIIPMAVARQRYASTMTRRRGCNESSASPPWVPEQCLSWGGSTTL